MKTKEKFTILSAATEQETSQYRLLQELDSIASYKDLNPWADAPDRQIIACNSQKEIIGRVSLWWSKTPNHKGLRTAYVGHYDALCDSVGAALLSEASNTAAQNRIEMLVGPLDGSTWKRYRLVTKRSEHPRFFLEPDNPSSYVDHFSNAGFLTSAIYRSSIANAAHPKDSTLSEIAERLKENNVTMRSLNHGDIDRELDRIFELCTESFKNNLFYTEISREEFVGMYKRILPLVDLRLTQIAERDGELVGFLFCYPNKVDAAGERTIVTKTLARKPDRAFRGLGKLLMHHVTEAGLQLGYKRIIHALYLGGNESEKISASYKSNIMREYSVFERVL